MVQAGTVRWAEMKFLWSDFKESDTARLNATIMLETDIAPEVRTK